VKKMRKPFFQSNREERTDFDREFNSLFDSLVFKNLERRYSVEKSILQSKFMNFDFSHESVKLDHLRKQIRG
jgi:hypothetical protein